MKRVNVLGVGVSAINMSVALSTIEQWIATGEQHYICVSGVHGVMESQRDEQLRQIHNASGLTTPDGMPLVWLGRLAGHRSIDRVYGPDLMLAMSEVSAAKGYRNYYYGGAEGVPEKLADSLQNRFPGLQVAGAFSPPFRPLTEEEDAQVIKKINESGADIVWIGLSTPKQERWAAAHVGRLKTPVLIGVGAAFDFHTGRVKQAPRWIQRSGFEWFYRMVQDPKRLAKRYLINNPRFVGLILMQFLGIKKFTINP